MRYSDLAETYVRMERTTKRIELTSLLAWLIAKTPPRLLDKVIYLTQGKIAADFLGKELGLAEKLVMRSISESSGLPVGRIEEKYSEVGDLGETARQLLSRKLQMSLFSEPLTLQGVFSSFEQIAETKGAGSIETKLRILNSLLSDAEPIEAKYIIRTVTGQLRLGIADYTILDALAEALTGEKAKRAELERAYNISSDLGYVARTLAEEGLEGIRRIRVKVGNPVRSMLAERLESAAQILKKMGGECAVEYKLDGERLQIHKGPRGLQIFSRRLEEISEQYPEVDGLLREGLKAKEAIVEAEAVAVDRETGDYLPFQELMHRRRKHGIKQAMKDYPVTLNFFDVIYIDGRDLTHESYTERRRMLEARVVEGDWVKTVTMRHASTPRQIESFMNMAISGGCEGIMAKSLTGQYRAGARGFAWIKLKREYASTLADTLDLTIVGAFHGRGRRAGWYGAFLLAAYDSKSGRFPSISKIGTGFTDQNLSELHGRLSPLIIPRRHVAVDSEMEADVWVKPQLVIETIASEVTLSPVHRAGYGVVKSDSGLALRFPKFTGRIRDDKRPEDAITVDEVVNLYRRQLKKLGS